MAKYLLIASRDPFESQDGETLFRLASALARAQNEVTLFLVQNGVFAARSGVAQSFLAESVGAGVEILADDFSLRERGISSKRIAAEVKAAPLEILVDRLAEGHRPLWS